MRGSFNISGYSFALTLTGMVLKSLFDYFKPKASSASSKNKTSKRKTRSRKLKNKNKIWVPDWIKIKRLKHPSRAVRLLKKNPLLYDRYKRYYKEGYRLKRVYVVEHVKHYGRIAVLAIPIDRDEVLVSDGKFSRGAYRHPYAIAWLWWNKYYSVFEPPKTYIFYMSKR